MQGSTCHLNLDRSATNHVGLKVESQPVYLLASRDSQARTIMDQPING